MKIQDKYYKKYGSNTVILPPPPEEAINQELTEEVEANPWDLPSEDELAQMPLHHPALPEIKPISEKEMHRWETWLKSKDTIKDYYVGGLAGKDDSTIPPKPGKSASADKLVELCDKFAHDAINPPAFDSVEVVSIPPSSKLPNIEEPDLEFMDKLFEIKNKNKEKKKKQQEEESALLKEIEHNPTMPIEASRLDELIKMSSKYYDLCRKL